MRQRAILHIDLDAFFCAVEERRQPQLRGLPFAVGGSPQRRGVVSSCSYAARKFGVHSALPMAQAVRLCPGLKIISPDFRAYGEASRAVMERLQAVTPLIEQISIDEAFLDVTGVPDPTATAAKLQARINEELDLPCSFGVATNKLVAKIANNVGKDRASQAHPDAPPNAILAVAPGEEAAFLAPLPIRDLWGVGPKTAERLNAISVFTIGDLAAWEAQDIATVLGKSYADLPSRARGEDDRPVEVEHEAKSVSKETTFERDITNEDELRLTLRQLADGVGWRLRKQGLRGSTVKLKIRWADFTTLSRQQTLARPVDQDDVINDAAQDLFSQVWRGQPVRLIGVGVSGFDEGGEQLELFTDPQDEQAQKLQAALDDLRSRFGENIIRRAEDVRRKPRK